MASDNRKYADRARYLIKAVAKRRKRIKQQSIMYLGGKCQVCGYSECPEALDFHHIDESKKNFGIAYKGHTKSWSRVKEELDKCYLLCANCHREVHAGKLQLPRAIEVEKQGKLSGSPNS